jgi:diacylglycerol kinase family enzyme
VPNPTQAAPDRIDVILNSGSGTADKQELAQLITGIFAEHRLEARLRVTSNGTELLEACQQAAAGDARVVVAGGGDGTIATVAHHLIDTDKVLGVLPLGTFNYFARNLGVPLEMRDALGVIVGGATTTVDVGEVNGQLFLNNSSIGLYPAILASRESIYRRFGRSQLAAYVSVALTLLKPPALVKLAVTADGRLLARRTPLLFVGTNAYQMKSFEIHGTECLDAHRLTLYITRPMGSLAIGRLAARALFRGLRGASAFEAVCAEDVVVALRRRHVRVALDGEVRVLSTPLHYRMRRDALKVIVPQQSPSES